MVNLYQDKLDNLCDISSSKRIHANEYVTYGIPFFRGKEIIEKHNNKDVSTELYISNEKYLEIKEKFGVPKCGDMLLTSVGTIGIPYIVDNNKFYFKDGNLTWFSNFKNLLSRYLYYYIISPIGKNKLLNLSIGSAQPALTIISLKNLEIEYPNIGTQHKIVKILSNYDDLIENNNKRIKILEGMAQKIYKEWFVDFKFPNHETAIFKQTELGEIPSDWNYRKLKDICSVIFSGGTPTTTAEEYWNGDLNWLSSGETNNKYIIDTQKTITELGVKKSSTRLAKTKDVVIASAGQGKTRGQVAYCFIDTFINQSIISMRSIDNIDYSNFIFFNLLSRYDELRLLSDSSSSRGSLTVKIMEDVNIILPSNAIIYKFNEILAPILGLIKKIQIKQQTLKQTRDLLLPRLISGEIDVENLEIV